MSLPHAADELTRKTASEEIAGRLRDIGLYLEEKEARAFVAMCFAGAPA